MLATVSFQRLDLIRTGRGPDGKRKYLNIQLDDANMQKVKACILNALGLSSLTVHL